MANSSSEDWANLQHLLYQQHTGGWGIRLQSSHTIERVTDARHSLKIDVAANEITLIQFRGWILIIGFLASVIFAGIKLLTQTKKYTWFFPIAGLIILPVAFYSLLRNVFVPAVFNFLNSLATLMDLKDKNVQYIAPGTQYLCNLDHYKK